MTIEELKNEYKAKVEKLHKEAIAENTRAKIYEGYRDLYVTNTPGYTQNAKIAMYARQKALNLIDEALIYSNFVRDLNNLETK